jgi:hypothetical protein
VAQPGDAARPDPRKSRRDTDVTLRVRADLRDTSPAVWRLLDLGSSIMLAQQALTWAGWRAGNEPLDSWQVARLLDDVVPVLDAMHGFEPRERGHIDQAVTPDGVLLARTVLARN